MPKLRKEHKDWIDKADYEALLRRSRFAPSCDQIFHGEAGKYFMKCLVKERARVGEAAHMAASKKIGWDK